MQGVKAVIAESFEKIHRSNLVGTGILPLQFMPGENADVLGLTGFEKFSIYIDDESLRVKQILEVTTDSGISFHVRSRLDTAIELEYFRSEGLLNFVLRSMMNEEIHT